VQGKFDLAGRAGEFGECLIAAGTAQPVVQQLSYRQTSILAGSADGQLPLPSF